MPKETCADKSLGTYYRSEGRNCSAPETYLDVSAQTAKSLIDYNPELVIVDVSPYYENGHIPGAISIPLSDLDAEIYSLSLKAPYLVYCHGDAPSISGANKLVSAGFSPVFRLQGNYDAWVAEGYPTEQ